MAKTDNYTAQALVVPVKQIGESYPNYQLTVNGEPVVAVDVVVNEENETVTIEFMTEADAEEITPDLEIIHDEEGGVLNITSHNPPRPE